MGSTERRAEHKQKLRNIILNESYKIISESGWDKLTIRKLAEAIDYSPRTIYLYFRNKEALINAIIEDVFIETAYRLDTLEKKLGDPMQVLKSTIDRHIRNGIQIPLLYRAIVNEVNKEDHVKGPAEIALISRLSDLLRKCISNKLRLSPQQLAEFMITTLRSTTLMLLNKLNELSRAEIDNYIDFYKNNFTRSLLWKEDPVL